MLYEIVWILYVMGIILFVGIGVFGLILSLSARFPKMKVIGIIFSLLSICIGIYFATRWEAEKKEIQEITIRLEEVIKKSMSQQRK